MPPPRPSPPGRRSWRDSQSPANSPGARTAGRWFFALLGVALLAYLGWLLWTPAAEKTHVVALPITAQDRLTVPPLAFAKEDALGLQDIASDQFVDWSDLQKAEELNSIGSRLEGLAPQALDVVILYVSAYGVSDDGEAYVLTSDLLRRTGGDRCKVSDLLRQIREAPGKKLLVLDCGRLGSNARLGMLANEFPRLVEKQVRDLNEQKDADLWVLLSSSSLQITGTTLSAKKSIFGQSVTEALLGHADVPNTLVPEEGGNNDYRVSLKEFGSYLINRVADWYGSERSAAPTPLFLRGGTGLVPLHELPSDLVLARLPASWNKPPAANKDANGKTDAKGEEKVTSLPLVRGGPLVSAELLQVPAGTPPAKTPTTQTPETPAPETPAKKAETAEKPSPQADVKAPAGTEGSEKKEAIARPTKKSAPEKTSAGEKPVTGKPTPADSEKHSELLRSQRELRKSLDQAWQLRDKLQSRSAPGGWSPIDFAPHLWRWLNASLLNYEQQCPAGEAFSPVVSTRELDVLVADLKQLDSQMNGSEAFPAGGDDASVGTRLADAWKRFSSQRELLDSFTQAPPELDEVKQAVRFQADNAFAATYYVRWHERASFSAGERLAQFDDLVEFLERLEKFGNDLHALEGKPFDPSKAPYLRDDRKEIENVRERIDQRLTQDAAAALKSIDQPVNERMVEDLLSTPLLSATRRKELLDRLLESGRPFPPRKPLFDAVKRQGGLTASSARWDRLLDRLDLERKLIRLFDPKLAGQIDGQFDTVKLLPRNSPGEETLWDQYREMGKLLRRNLGELPKTIEDLAHDSANEMSARRAELLLPLIDARDARSLPADLDFRPRLRVLPARKDPQLAIKTDEELLLDIKEWHQMKVVVEASGQESDIISTVARFEPDYLEIRVAGGANIASGDQQLVKLGSDNRAALDWEVRAKTDRVDATKLLILAQSGKLRDEHSVHCGLPKPNEIDLIVTRAGRSVPEQKAGQDGIQLRAFPNRETSFRLSLSNRSGKAKKVKVELLSVPPQPAAKWAPGRLYAEGALQPGIRRSLFDGADKLLPNAKVLATAKSFALPADPTAVEIDFTPPAPAAAPKPAASEGAAGAPPPMPTAPPKPDVTQGLLCILTNLDEPTERWLKWIEFNPLQPKDYLDAEIGYDLTQERILVNLKPKLLPDESQPKPEEVLPIDLAEKPIPIVWDTFGEIPAASARSEHAVFDGGKPSANLFAVVPPDEKDRKERIVRLTVDGYPRAFVYRVDCRDTQPGEDLKPARQHVRINSVESPDFLKTFYFSPAAKPKEPPPPGPGAKVPVLLEAGMAATIPAPCKRLRVQFEVDVPKDAFQLSGRDDQVEVGLDVEGADKQRFYADRQMTTRLVAVGPQGLLTLHTEVSDYAIELDPEGLQNKLCQLTAQLVLAGSNVQGDRVPVVLDGLPPAIKTFSTLPDAGQAVIPGEKLVAQLNVSDLSGVAQVEFGFDLNQSGELEKEEAKILLALAQPPANDVWQLELSTKDLPPGRNVLMARATDRVGLQSRPKDLVLRVPSPDTVKGKMDKGTIKGVVMFGKLPADNIKITLSFPGAGVQRTKNGGKFQFDNIPEGEYTLQAGGSVQNVVRQGKLEKIHPSPPDKPENVILMLE